MRYIKKNFCMSLNQTSPYNTHATQKVVSNAAHTNTGTPSGAPMSFPFRGTMSMWAIGMVPRSATPHAANGLPTAHVGLSTSASAQPSPFLHQWGVPASASASAFAPAPRTANQWGVPASASASSRIAPPVLARRGASASASGSASASRVVPRTTTSGTRKQMRAQNTKHDRMRGIRTLRDTLFLQSALTCDSLDASERQTTYVALDHTNMVVCKRNTLARPASLAAITRHIKDYSNVIREAIVAGTALTTHRTLDLTLFRPVLDMPAGQPENGETDKELIRQSYDLIDDAHAKNAAPQTLVLVTGDGNKGNGRENGRVLSFPAVARHALTHGWKVVIYARIGHCNKELVTVSQQNPARCALFYIDTDGHTITPGLDVDEAGNIICTMRRA